MGTSVVLKLEGVVGASLDDIAYEMQRLAERLEIPTQCKINNVEATFIPHRGNHSRKRLLAAVREAQNVTEPTTLSMAGSDGSYVVLGAGGKMIKHKKGELSDVMWDILNPKKI